ncbi:MAG TPA: amidohydrolase family protein [Candidatus Binatia bacterium]|jgi:predicted TIM-barrel fold metal-dependent hydrolase|nr:amidohydrolase family protein [Candidatus Binatia bacterium]
MTTKVISADSHIMEPPTLWAERIDQAFRARAPRVVTEWKGKKGEFLVCDGRLLRPVYGGFPANKPLHEIPPYPQSAHPRERTEYANARPGGWDPVERMKDQDIDGVAAEVLYATSALVFFSVEDLALQRALFYAYNDWLAEFCSYNPKRLIGLALISLEDIEAAVQELERCTKRGLKGALISVSPDAEKQYDNPVYDRFWAAAQDCQIPLSMHLATGKRNIVTTARSPYAMYINIPEYMQQTLITLIFSGVLERFPRLKVLSTEHDIGWIAYFLLRMDRAYERFRQSDPIPLTMPPSGYFKRQVYATFQDDPVGLATCRFLAADNILWASDYPHVDSTWPHSQSVIEQQFAEVSEEDKYKILCANAAKLYGIALE